MVRAHVDTAPSFLGGPVGVGTAPERVGLGEAEGEESGREQVEAAGIDVLFAHPRLAAGEAHAEPAVPVEGAQPQLQPGRDAADRPPECLQLGDFLSERVLGQGLERHVRLKGPLGQVLQDRPCDAGHLFDPFCPALGPGDVPQQQRCEEN